MPLLAVGQVLRVVFDPPVANVSIPFTLDVSLDEDDVLCTSFTAGRDGLARLNSSFVLKPNVLTHSPLLRVSVSSPSLSQPLRGVVQIPPEEPPRSVRVKINLSVRDVSHSVTKWLPAGHVYVNFSPPSSPASPSASVTRAITPLSPEGAAPHLSASGNSENMQTIEASNLVNGWGVARVTPRRGDGSPSRSPVKSRVGGIPLPAAPLSSSQSPSLASHVDAGLPVAASPTVSGGVDASLLSPSFAPDPPFDVEPSHFQRPVRPAGGGGAPVGHSGGHGSRGEEELGGGDEEEGLGSATAEVGRPLSSEGREVGVVEESMKRAQSDGGAGDGALLKAFIESDRRRVEALLIQHVEAVEWRGRHDARRVNRLFSDALCAAVASVHSHHGVVAPTVNADPDGCASDSVADETRMAVAKLESLVGVVLGNLRPPPLTLPDVISLAGLVRAFEHLGCPAQNYRSCVALLAAAATHSPPSSSLSAPVRPPGGACCEASHSVVRSLGQALSSSIEVSCSSSSAAAAAAADVAAARQQLALLRQDVRRLEALEASATRGEGRVGDAVAAVGARGRDEGGTHSTDVGGDSDVAAVETTAAFSQSSATANRGDGGVAVPVVGGSDVVRSGEGIRISGTAVTARAKRRSIACGGASAGARIVQSREDFPSSAADASSPATTSPSPPMLLESYPPLPSQRKPTRVSGAAPIATPLSPITWAACVLLPPSPRFSNVSPPPSTIVDNTSHLTEGPHESAAERLMVSPQRGDLECSGDPMAESEQRASSVEVAAAGPSHHPGHLSSPPADQFPNHVDVGRGPSVGQSLSTDGMPMQSSVTSNAPTSLTCESVDVTSTTEPLVHGMRAQIVPTRDEGTAEVAGSTTQRTGDRLPSKRLSSRGGRGGVDTRSRSSGKSASHHVAQLRQLKAELEAQHGASVGALMSKVAALPRGDRAAGERWLSENAASLLLAE